MMEANDYVSYDLALKLKECGFDWRTDHLYRKDADNGDQYTLTHSGFDNYNEHWSASDWCSAPSLYAAQKWLREKKGIAINVIAHDISDKYREGEYHWEGVYLPNFSEEGHQWHDWLIYGKHPLFDTYEEALSDGLNQMLRLIEKGE